MLVSKIYIFIKRIMCKVSYSPLGFNLSGLNHVSVKEKKESGLVVDK